MESERRLLYRQGALLLVISALLGLVIVAPVGHPGKWMAAHMTGIISGVLIIAFGGVWSELRLTPGVRTWAMRLGLTAAWVGLAANVYAAIVNLPGPATDPGRQPDAAWQGLVFAGFLVIVVPSTLASFALVWRGLK